MATSKIPTNATSSRLKQAPRAAIVRPTTSRILKETSTTLEPPKVPLSAFTSSASTSTSLAKTTLTSLRSPRATSARPKANPSVTVRKPVANREPLYTVVPAIVPTIFDQSPVKKQPPAPAQAPVSKYELQPSKQAELSSVHLDFTSLSDDVVTIRSLLEKVYKEVQGTNVIQERLIDENKKLKAELRILRDKMKSLQAIASPIDSDLVIPEELEVFSGSVTRKAGPSLYYTPRK